MDVSEPGALNGITEVTRDLQVGLLIASAGWGTSGPFIQSSIEQEINMLRVNCEALLRLTYHFAKKFAAQCLGGIILLSSIVAFQGVPYAAHYAATKAYVQTLAEGLSAELKPCGRDVLAAAPGRVSSGFGGRAHMTMTTALRPEEVGVPILRALGKKSTVFPVRLTRVMILGF